MSPFMAHFCWYLSLMVRFLRIYFPPDWRSVSFFLALALGATFRFVGIGFDLPVITHPDETKVVEAVVDMVERRSFEPAEFTWPGHVVMMLGYFFANLYSYVLFGVGPETAINQVGMEHWYLSTRLAVATVGSVGILLAYLIGARIRREIGVVAAVLVAFFPPFVQDSHFATTDIVLSVAVLAVILSAMVYLDSPRYPALLWMSFLTAVAIATKYPGLIAAGMIAVVVAIRALTDKDFRRFLKHGFASVFSLVGFLFAISPVLFTERHMVFRSIGNENRTTALGADGLGYVERLVFYWSQYYGSTGWLLLVPFVIGLVAIVRLRIVKAVPFFIGAVFWIILSSLALHWIRWGMPMYLTPLLVSAVGVYFLFDLVAKKMNRFKTPARIALLGASVIATANLIASSVAISAGLLVTDTRTFAIEEFERLGVTEENSVFEGYTVHKSSMPGSVFRYFDQQENRLVPLENDFDYVVISSSMYGRYFDSAKFAERQDFYRILEETYPLVYQIGPRGESEASANPFSNVVKKSSFVLGVIRGDSMKGPTMKVFAVPDDVRHLRHVD